MADPANTDGVWVGVRPNLTADTAAATDGFRLAPGDSELVAASSEAKVFAVSDAAAQNVTFLSR